MPRFTYNEIHVSIKYSVANVAMANVLPVTGVNVFESIHFVYVRSLVYSFVFPRRAHVHGMQGAALGVAVQFARTR